MGSHERQPCCSQPSGDILTLAVRLLVALLRACLGLLAGLVIFTLGIRLAYSGRALPGVTAAGVSLAGRNQAEIETAMAQALTYPETGLILLTDGRPLACPAH